MPDPASLPTELFDQIITEALQDPSYDEYTRAFDFHDGIDLCQLPNLLRINRHWHNILIPRLYSKYSYNGARHTYTSLWEFLRAVATNRELAEMVKSLNIGNCGFYPDVLRLDREATEDNVDFSYDEVSLMRWVIQAGLRGSPNTEGLESSILDPKALRDRDCRPLVVLLLLCLPNLSTIYIHLPQSNTLLHSILLEVLSSQERGSPVPCLQRLTELHVLGEVAVRAPVTNRVSQEESPVVRFDDIWPCIYFSNLRTLALYDLDTAGIGSLLGQHRDKTSRIQKLRVVISGKSTCTTSDARTLVTLPDSLTHFSFCWNFGGRLGDDRDDGRLSVLGLWNAIQKHRDTLEHLDVHNDNPYRRENPNRGHFGSLQSFTRLKRLDTQTDLLLDALHKDPAPLCLKDTLPQNLDALILRLGLATKTIPNFDATELQAAVGERSRPLKLLALGHNGHQVGRYYRQIQQLDNQGNSDELDQPGPEPYPGLWPTCKKVGTQLHVSIACNRTRPTGYCHFGRGGACGWLWRKTWMLRDEGIHRSRLMLVQVPPTGDEIQARAKKQKEKNTRARPLPARIIPFADHTGNNNAFIVFKNSLSTANSRLPPLFPFVVYFTHPSTKQTPEATDLVGLYDAIRYPLINPDLHFRLDVYFLPGASEEDCKEHYLAARASRPNYVTLIEEFKAAEAALKSTNTVSNTSSHPHPSQRLPGMAHTHPGLEPSKALLLRCREPNWREGAQRIFCLMFDNMTIEEMIEAEAKEKKAARAAAGDDADEDDGSEDEDEEDIWEDPVDTTVSLRVTEESPMAREDGEDTGQVLGHWLEMYTAQAIQEQYDLRSIHSRAVGMGWASW
ncbi:hypothetical protein BJX63DRAFT_442393 [Aspergillus granulosus]|uniref:F-box domain-containing protein n=1 Tax=Aspergillus granulosus TaxID=176169 RepID=A0ABR4HH50_9EURO